MSLFDRSLIARRRNRVAATFQSAAFLKQRAVDDVCDRLGAINRRFATALDIGSHGGFLRASLSQRDDLTDKIGTLFETDLSPAMLAGVPGPRMVADEDCMPLAEGSLDLIVSSLGLHWVNDVPGFLAQVRLALKPDGLFLGAFLGGRTLQELRAVMAEVDSRHHGTAQPRVSPFADAQDGAQLLQRTGFALPVADSDVVTVRYANVFGLFRDLKAMGENAAFAAPPRRPLTRGMIAEVASLYQERYGDPDGRVRATFEIVTLTGWAPHESQQKPLRPGSAKMRLADALGSVEQPAGEPTDPRPR